MNVSHCAPKRYRHFKEFGTCFDVSELRILAKSFNDALDKSTGPLANALQSKKKTSPIDLEYARRLTPDEEKVYLKRALTLKLKNIKEHAWADLLIDPDRNVKVYDAVQSALRPPLPKSWLENSHQWLSTQDIEEVMEQYEEAYPDFKLLGVFPIDFDFVPRHYNGHCVADEMCMLSVEALMKNGISQFGAVINLDKHYQPGSHWVALYSCLDPASKNFGIHYFDSVAHNTPSQIKTFMQRIANQLAKVHGIPASKVPVTSNDKQLQYKNTECGIFAMYFIACCVSNKIDVKDVWQAMALDDVIHMLRNVFYRPPHSTIK